MAYAAQTDMVSRFGEDEVVAITDRQMSGAIDPDALGDALDTASAEMDTYLSGRYQLPLAPVPRFLVTLCCDIARYQLCVGGTRLSDDIRDRYRDAVRFLELAAAGKVTLGVTAVGQVQPVNTVEFNVGTKIFSQRDRGAF
ncbi:gp436 family protein [Paraburkholderia unamae]|uniref:Phage gp36-like protein n=1 Tax=Paraburkholderia unamae TaxID=219649 RepID=A0ABX5KLZ9_9BURK|nr:phage protein Gp36 family protein [Paraburkholderia unamae]PVX80050.1 phage gp36-like protein [Paraburkholderia unamae]